jgi:hypothetical protein
MMRMIWIAEEKRRAERQAREALYVPATQEEEEHEEDKLEEISASNAQSKGIRPEIGGFRVTADAFHR